MSDDTLPDWCLPPGVLPGSPTGLPGPGLGLGDRPIYMSQRGRAVSLYFVSQTGDRTWIDTN